VGLKWVFKIKYIEDNNIVKHKDSQQPGVDFTKTFMPIARMETIRIVIALSV
jgi:methyl coenzyme M reductase gamma subunit